MKSFKVIGLMSGTSLDGVDIVYCHFRYNNGKWKYKVLKAKTIPYSKFWYERLKKLDKTDAFTFVKTHFEYGHFLGRITNRFIKKNNLKVDFISSHGHTIFHQPDKKITCQIGDGAAISAECGIPVICDFRTTDVALGGQGAPLVPIGDKLLFADYTYCLNLGGFANISFDEPQNCQRIAFDICPVNTVLNSLTRTIGKPYDKDGKIAEKGNINAELLNELNNISFYKKKHPKSISKEWLDAEFFPVLNKYEISIEDKLRTVIEHITEQIARVISYYSKQYKTLNSGCNKYKENTLFITGGGAYNKFLIDKIKEKTNCKIEIPDKIIIEFKEAIIFAFLGILRILKKPNCLKSVTGARKDSICGTIYTVI